MKQSIGDASDAREPGSDRWTKIERMLDAALDVDPGEWPALLDRLCGGDSTLRREAESLLRRHTRAQRFLAEPVAEFDLSEGEPEGESPLAGRRIGAYRIVDDIARGGMGRVLLAERADGQFEQRAAIKLLLSELEGDAAFRRFRAERQILATLTHPSIARLIDGGVTDEGWPFLVMEFVEGEPIDRYCETKRLPVQDRLRLFLQVTEAVQYAHRNLIVHRDLKPSNIYVTRDGQVKLLDFGIAKLLDENAGGEAAPRTQMGRRWMTPEYAAPEQIRGEPITTATDVYQLGVVLYQLLSGRRPFERNGGSLHNLEQAVLTRDPEKPSTAAALPKRRSPSTARLYRILRGDLDAIVLKALRKEPLARYASAQALAGDIEYYLKGLPVAARRGTTTYRAKKFVGRHRWGVGMAAALVLLIAGYTVTATVQGARLRKALDQSRIEATKAEQVSDFLMGVFEASDADEATVEGVTARDLLERGVARADELSSQPEVQAEMLNLMGGVYRHYGEFDQAQRLLERSLALRRQALGEENEEVAASLTGLGRLLLDKGNSAAAESLFERALAMRRKLLGDEHREVASSMVDLARALDNQGRYDRAEALQREALAMRRRLLGDEHRDVAVSLNEMAELLWRRGDAAAAEPLFRQVLALNRKLYGQEHWFVANVMNNLGLVLIDKQEYASAESLFVGSIAMKEKLLGKDHPSAIPSMSNLANVWRLEGDYEKADSLYRRTIEIARATYGDVNPVVMKALRGLARTDLDRQRASDAEPLLREALAILRKSAPDDRRNVAVVKSLLGRCLTMMGQYAEAESLLVQSYPVLVAEYGEADYRPQEARQFLVDLFTAEGKTAEAEAYLPRIGRERDE